MKSYKNKFQNLFILYNHRFEKLIFRLDMIHSKSLYNDTSYCVKKGHKNAIWGLNKKNKAFK